MADDLVIYLNKKYQHELMKAEAIEPVSSQHYVLKNMDKAAEVFQIHIDVGRLKDADQLMADEITNSKGKVYFKLSSDVSVYRVANGIVNERTLTPFPLKVETKAVPEGKQNEMLAEVGRFRLLEQFRNVIVTLKAEYGAGSAFAIERQIHENPEEARELTPKYNVSRFFEKLGNTLRDQIANGQRTELPSISKSAVDRHLSELGKMQDHQMADRYIDTAVGIYTKRKLIER